MTHQNWWFWERLMSVSEMDMLVCIRKDDTFVTAKGEFESMFSLQIIFIVHHSWLSSLNLFFLSTKKNIVCNYSQVRLWTNNPDQFVEDEDDETFSYSVRISAQDLLLVREHVQSFFMNRVTVK